MNFAAASRILANMPQAEPEKMRLTEDWLFIVGKRKGAMGGVRVHGIF